MPSNLYRKVKTLSQPDAAYLAGLIDGEGTVTLSRKHKNDNRQLCVSISSTEFEILDHVMLITGVGKITNKKTSKFRHSASFTYSVTNRHALLILEQVQPWLQSYKKQRSKLILKDYLSVTPRNGKYTPELLEKKLIFERDVLAIKPNS